MRLVFTIFLFILFTICSSEKLYAQERIDGHQYLLQRRPGLAERDTNFLRQNFFMLGMGVESLIYTGFQEKPIWGTTAKLGVGRWFNSISGIRFGLEGAIYQRIPMDEYNQRLTRAGLTVDYMLQITALGVGYNPYRFFNLSLYGGLGANLSMTGNDVTDVYAVRMGLLSSFKLSPFSSFYLEPGVSLFSDDVDFHKNWRDYNIAASVTAGILYRMVPTVERRDQREWTSGKFFENTFIMIGGGSEVLLGADLRNSFRSPGYNVKFATGKRFTPVSGMRLTVMGGRSDVEQEWLSTVRTGIDYMLNLNGMAYGNVNRTNVGLAITVGPSVAYTKNNGIERWAVGGGAGVLSTFRVSPGTQFFVEPRISVYDNRLTNGYTHKQFDALAELTAGFIFHRYSEDVRQLRYDVGVDRYRGKLRTDGKHCLLFAGGGVQTIFSENMGRHQYQPIARGGLGYWLSPTSGFRISGQMGLLAESDEKKSYIRTKTVSAGVDYMFNITNALRGYVPGRKTELVASVGGEMLYNTKRQPDQERFNYGITGGVEGIWNVSSQIYLYTGPRIGLFTPDVVLSKTRFLGGDLITSWTLGMGYRFGQYDKQANREIRLNGEKGDYFMTIGAGAGTIVCESPRNWQLGGGAMFAFGKRFTPVSSWRLGLRMEVLPEIYSYKGNGYSKYMGLDADYMMSLVTLANGYKERRILDVLPLVGVSAGWTHSAGQFNFVPGVHTGLQGKMRLSSTTSLFIEPRIAAYGKHYENYNHRDFDFALSVMAGINYRFAYPDNGAGRALFGKGSFVSVGAGTGIFINRFSRHDIAGSLTMNYNIQAGKWHTPVSGTRVGVYQSNVNYKTTDAKHFDLGSCGIHAGYLLNISSLLKQKQQVLSLIALGEIGVDKAKFGNYKHWVPSFTAGGQALFHATRKVGIYAEARGVIYSDNMMPYKPSIRTFAAFQTMLGVSRKF